MLHKSSRWLLALLSISLLALGACAALQDATPAATRTISGPTLAPSPTINLRTSDELYGNNLAGQNDPTAAAHPNESVLPPVVLATRSASTSETVQIVMDDGTFLQADLYERFDASAQPLAIVDDAGRFRVPGLLLLAPDRAAWGALPGRLSVAGFTVMVAGMRAIPRAADVDVLLNTLADLSTVDPGRLAVVGAAEGADLALLGCTITPLCDAAALISPLAGDILVDVMADFNPRPLWVAAAQDDAESYRTMVLLSTSATGPTRLSEYASGRGTALIAASPEVVERLGAWLASTLAR